MEKGDSDAMVAHRVWYRAQPRESFFGDGFAAYEDIGTLRVFDDRVVFAGRKNSMDYGPISSFDVRFHGADFINRWIRVRFEDGRTALFCNGYLLGWIGALGGTAWLARRLRNRMPEPEAAKGLDLWWTLLGFLPAAVLLGLLALLFLA